MPFGDKSFFEFFGKFSLFLELNSTNFLFFFLVYEIAKILKPQN